LAWNGDRENMPNSRLLSKQLSAKGIDGFKEKNTSFQYWIINYHSS
jgi:hypothetical protein